MNPKHSRLLQKAQALARAGKIEEASVACSEFLNREPRHSGAWADLGRYLLTLGKFQEAQAACEAALGIDPQSLTARIDLGCILMRRNRLEEAEDQFRSILKVDSHRMGVQLFLAECLLNKRDLDGVLKVLESANQPGVMTGRYAALQPHHAELWALLGSALIDTQRFQEAEDACATSLQIDPLSFRARANLGSIRMAQGQLPAAEALFRRLVADHPREEKARLLLITCLARTGDAGSTCQEIAQVLQLAPTSFLVHKSVMGPYYSLGCWAEYRAEIERFRKVAPGLAYLDYEQSFADLLFGNMLQGWKRFEARLHVPDDLRPKRIFEQPSWKGEPFEGKTLLLWTEQGLGDTLMFARYLPMVKALGGRVILETQPALMGVAATCKGADLVISEGTPLPTFDLQVSVMSLPWIFRTELSTVPDQIPYLAVPKEVKNRRTIQETLAVGQETTRIGLVWAGNRNHARDVERSLPPSSLAPLATLPGVTWYSFQLGSREDPPLPNLVSLAPLLETFSDTACALSGMDLLITVDTSVTHLAGAMGIPTFLLLTFQPDYRWMLDRDDSPWYPTLRLYRQPKYGDWEAVIRNVITDLTQEPEDGTEPQRVLAP